MYIDVGHTYNQFFFEWISVDSGWASLYTLMSSYLFSFTNAFAKPTDVESLHDWDQIMFYTPLLPNMHAAGHFWRRVLPRR